MHPPEVSVGLISTIIHVIALVMMTFTCMVGARCLRQLANFELNKHGRAPVVFHPYSTIFGSIFGMKRLTKLNTPGYSIVLILVFLLLPAEITLNFAVDTCVKCQPRRIETKGLCATTPKTKLRKQIGIFYSIQSMPWNDEDLERSKVRQGLRRDIQGNEYFGYELNRNTSLPVVISGCTVSKMKIIPPNDTTIVLGNHHDYKMYGAFRELRIGNSSVKGIGTMNEKRILALSYGKKWLKTGINLTIFEYYDSEDVKKFRKLLGIRKKWTRLSLASPIISYNVSCEQTGLSLEDATKALKWYRFTQLDASRLKTFNITTDDGRIVSAANQMSAASTMKAMIAMKFMEQEDCLGETWEWTQCGIVRPLFAIPIITITLSMFVLFAILEISSHVMKLRIHVPVDAMEWYNFAMLTSFQRTHVKLSEAKYKCSAKSNKCAVVLRDHESCNPVESIDSLALTDAEDFS